MPHIALQVEVSLVGQSLGHREREETGFVLQVGFEKKQHKQSSGVKETFSVMFAHLFHPDVG